MIEDKGKDGPRSRKRRYTTDIPEPHIIESTPHCNRLYILPFREEFSKFLDRHV